MYGREINGRVHTFGVSGKLIMNALVMYDHQTDTLWSQFLRRGVRGELAGTELEVIPVTQTTWAAWLELHPDTVALNKSGRYQGDSYTSYYASRSAGVIGESNSDDRLGSKELVVGVDVQGNTKAYPFAELARRQVVNDSFFGQDVLVYFDKGTNTALVYDRNVDGRKLTFRLEGEPSGVQTILVDEETGSTWLAFTGRAIDGELKGETMERMLSHLSFWFAWTDWNPDTELYTG
ncbi:MAG: DUF3179 domain-containing protein [Chloroflexi bacterium]|nr:DUF3179 domain-containing protein [Chloroflexota bacterium]MCI0791645.1 DUF3179 domain-containing protein [Chloroflexota bacterium]